MTRARLVEVAQSYVGSNDRAGFWVKALGYDPGKSKAWCGAFYLACLREAGLTDHKWGIDGTGVQALRLPRTAHPEPGDLGYQDKPWQHHFLVESVGAETYSSIDGNQGTPGVQRKNRAFKTTGVVFFSIAKLLRSDTDPAPQPERPTLRLGSQGDAVGEMQTLLAAAGFPALKVDKSFGPITANVLMQFQRRAGLQPDAVCGPYTWAALERAVRNDP